MAMYTVSVQKKKNVLKVSCVSNTSVQYRHQTARSNITETSNIETSNIISMSLLICVLHFDESPLSGVFTLRKNDILLSAYSHYEDNRSCSTVDILVSLSIPSYKQDPG